MPAGARRQDLCRADRLRPVGRCPSHHRPGRGRRRRLSLHEAAIKRAGITPAEIDYINAHGTSTPLGDEIELDAVQRLVGNAAGRIPRCRPPSRRSATCWARQGRWRRSFRSWLCATQIVPPTLNLDNPSVETAIDLVPHKAESRKIDVALSNSFGFGGTNASLVFRRFHG